MFAKIPEKYMHLTRWGLAIGWLILIASMFYDPISAQLTASNQLFAASTTTGCYQFQGQCRPLTDYPLGARIFWGMVLPLSIITLLVFGHEAWRRICPLSFLSQIPRALGRQGKRTVDESSWLGRNALYLQFSLLFIGLNLRLLLVNSDRLLLGIFLLSTILLAITVGSLYDGKTWCHYFCPMAPVQMIYSEPSGLLGSEAHQAPPKTITQSMCRTVDKSGQEKSACVACKVGCIDIDAEGAYWEGIKKPDRKLLYYAYVGLVIGFYLYFWLYSGSWSFLSAGVWNETNQLATLLQPGFFIAGQAIAIPKLIAVPLTLTVTSGMTYAIGLWAEWYYKRYNKRQRHPLSSEQVQSRMFAIATFTAFNLLFFMGVRPTLGYLPAPIQQILSWAAVVASSLWVVKSWNRSMQRYNRERDANLLRRQLSKLNIDLSQFLEGRTMEQLKPDELYALAKVLPGFSNNYRLQIYQGTLKEALEQGSVTPVRSLKVFHTLRQKLEISEELHWTILDQLQTEAPNLFPASQGHRDSETTVIRRSPAPHTTAEATVYRPIDRRSETPPAQQTPAAQPDRSISFNELDQTVIKPTAQDIPPSDSRPDS
ncbi:MAG: hypothetical protein KME15_04230 [Drouetiella hepatica Uher 2000/2452]|jgi:hypothetical protein|uniref:4Fe-4S binding protein n=1 Tax=Drouetiella hepatica Uher 2000/2452 TaxID=904376 RepID=A0A951Q7R8_9CYAN|nr:hypothetical protein [Drouetiella hepatica Uher 2000/2452]